MHFKQAAGPLATFCFFESHLYKYQDVVSYQSSHTHTHISPSLFPAGSLSYLSCSPSVSIFPCSLFTLCRVRYSAHVTPAPTCTVWQSHTQQTHFPPHFSPGLVSTFLNCSISNSFRCSIMRACSCVSGPRVLIASWWCTGGCYCEAILTSMQLHAPPAV